MAEARGVGNTLRGKPLYIFYDCEATGLNVETDRLIEIGAILCTENLTPKTAQILQQDNQFTSLCYCTHPINPESAKVLTLTLQDLQGAPSTVEVLNRFRLWIKERVSMAEQSERTIHTPVLVAHSGNRLDYPLLFKEVELAAGSYSLKYNFRQLKLHYTDSHSAIRQLARTDRFFQDLPGLGVKDLHLSLVGRPYDGHRALPDAQALYDIFTKSSKQRSLFGEIYKFIKSKEGVEMTIEQIPKFLNARIKPAKAEELLLKGITYDDILQQYKRRPHKFESYLKRTCGITKPKMELLDHFKSTLDTSDESDSYDSSGDHYDDYY